MYVDGKPFIQYNDFHLPLSEADVGFLEYMRQNPGKVRRRLPGGAGMNEVLDEYTLEHLVRMGAFRNKRRRGGERAHHAQHTHDGRAWKDHQWR